MNQFRHKINTCAEIKSLAGFLISLIWQWKTNVLEMITSSKCLEVVLENNII